jgi:hypothetical protein
LKLAGLSEGAAHLQNRRTSGKNHQRKSSAIVSLTGAFVTVSSVLLGCRYPRYVIHVQFIIPSQSTPHQQYLPAATDLIIHFDTLLVSSAL